MPKGADMKIVSAPSLCSSLMPAGCSSGRLFDIRRISCLCEILRCARGSVVCLCAVAERACKLLDCPQVIVRAQHFHQMSALDLINHFRIWHHFDQIFMKLPDKRIIILRKQEYDPAVQIREVIPNMRFCI